MNESPPSRAPQIFQPVTLLTGVVLGLIILAWAGRAVTRLDWHPGFVRFHPLLSPESHYQPTIGEMRAIVRAKCRPDQILVIIGGNSIFQGVGQPADKIWTRYLQQQLGDQYCVVNLAFRGSSPTDAGALTAESLRDEYPRQIYLANVPPFTGASPAGGLDYRFMLCDPLYKGWLLDLPARNAAVDDYLARSDLYPAAREISLGARLDAWFRFRDLWQWWSATHAFTFPTTLTPEISRAFKPRNAFADTEPDFEDMPFRERFDDRFAPAEMQITRNTSAQFYTETHAGKWVLSEFELSQFRKIAGYAFHDRLKTRTLIVLSRNSPYYTRQLSSMERSRDDLAFKDSIAEWRALGYGAMEYGPDFIDYDFGDRTHLTVSGGRKLASVVAPEIRQLAEKLGYLKP